MANRFNKRRNRSYGKMFTAGASGTTFAGKLAEKSAKGLFRWATTDHTGFAQAMNSMPVMGFVDTLRVVMLYLCYVVVYAVAMGVAVFFTVAFWIPFLFGILFFY